LHSNAFPAMKLEMDKSIEYLRKTPSVEIDRVMGLIALDNVCNGILGTNIDALNHDNIMLRSTWGYVNAMDKLLHNPLHFFGSVPYKGRECWKNIKREVQIVLQNFQNPNANTQSSLLSVYIDAIKNKEMTMEEVMDNLAMTIVAGHETTAHTISFFLYCMATNKDIANEARKEVDSILGERRIPELDDMKTFEKSYLKNCLHETLRMFPVVAKTFRVLSSDQDVGGFKIPAETSVWFSYYSMNHNPKHWENPEKFIPERFDDITNVNKLSTFSFGPRSCIGMQFSKLEMMLIMATLLRNFKFEIDSPNYKLVVHVGADLYPLGGIPMKFVYRQD